MLTEWRKGIGRLIKESKHESQPRSLISLMLHEANNFSDANEKAAVAKILQLIALKGLRQEVLL